MEIERLQNLIRQRETAYKNMRKAYCRATKTNAVISSDTQAKGTPSDKVGDGAIEYADAKEQFERIKNEITILKNQVFTLLHLLNTEEEKAIAIERFVDEKSIKTIAIDFSYSESYIHRLLKIIKEVLEDEEMKTEIVRENERVTVATDDPVLIKNIMRLRNRKPEDVTYECKDGNFMTACIPASWVRFSPKRDGKLRGEKKAEFERRIAEKRAQGKRVYNDV